MSSVVLGDWQSCPHKVRSCAFRTVSGAAGLSAMVVAQGLSPPQARGGLAREQGFFVAAFGWKGDKKWWRVAGGLTRVEPAPVRGSVPEPVVSVELAAMGAESEARDLNSQRARTWGGLSLSWHRRVVGVAARVRGTDVRAHSRSRCLVSWVEHLLLV